MKKILLALLFIATFIAVVYCAEEGAPPAKFLDWQCNTICNNDCTQAGFNGGRCINGVCNCYFPLP